MKESTAMEVAIMKFTQRTETFLSTLDESDPLLRAAELGRQANLLIDEGRRVEADVLLDEAFALMEYAA